MLLFVDCTTGQSVLIYGEYEPNVKGSSLNGSFIKFIQKPYGPISITPQSEVDELINTAKTNDLKVVEDAKTFLEGKQKRDRYDFACGCKLYYPDSVAATD
jgi:phosphosulfolactate synthase (CoM biosynthesis protein A)